MNGNKRTQSSASNGLLTVNITTHTPQGEFSGEGLDAFGKFTVQGQIKDREVTILKKYSDSQGGFESTWRYSGTLNEDGDEVNGNITQESGGQNDEDSDSDSAEDEDEDEEDEEEDEEEEEEEEEDGEEEGEDGENENEGEGEEKEENSAPVADAAPNHIPDDSAEQKNGGSFTLSRKPVEYYMCRPLAKEYQENQAQALWKLLRNILTYRAQRRHLWWDVIKERREKRDHYVKLLGKIRQNGRLRNSKQIAEWSELVRSVHPDDLNLWRSIVFFKRLRQPMTE